MKWTKAGTVLLLSLAATPALAQSLGGTGADPNHYLSFHLWQQTLTSNDTTSSTVGVRLLSNVRIAGNLRLGLRAETSALPGERFKVSDLNSYDTGEVYGSLYYNIAKQGALSLGIGGVAGRQFSFSDVYESTSTYGGCLRGSWEQSFAYACYGSHDAAIPTVALREAAAGSKGLFGMFRIRVKGAVAISGDFAFIAGHRLLRIGPEASVSF